MTSDDQQFLDLLASIPQDMAHYGSRIADYIEKHTNAIASEIRDALDNATWLPESMRPLRPQAHHFFARPPPPPQGFVATTTAWVSKNRTAIAIVVAFAGTTALLIHRRKRAHARKRRAKKFANGAKKEIVVLACSSFHDPLTRSLALDLERRGYIVYVTVSSTEEDSLVHAETKPDIRPLWMDLTSTVPNPAIDIHPNLEQIRELIARSSRSSSPGSARSGVSATAQNLTLAGVVVLPGSSGYPTGPLVTLPPSDVIDTINTRLLAPILTVQQFLPLLANHTTDPKFPSSIVLAYPSITLSLSPPNTVPESVTTSSLTSLAACLRHEIRAAGANINLTELKLGNFDLGSTDSPTTYSRPPHARDLDTMSNNVTPNQNPSSSALTTTHWHSSQRAAAQRSSLGQSSLIKGSSAREFHNAVFDALAPPQTFKAFGRFEWSIGGQRSRNTVVFVGSGARVYDFVGRLMPTGLVAWMMGYGCARGKGVGANPSATSGAAGRGVRSSSGPRRGDSGTPVWGSGSASGSTAGSVVGSAESGVWEKVYG